jgi:hypothetical protein
VTDPRLLVICPQDDGFIRLLDDVARPVLPSDPSDVTLLVGPEATRANVEALVKSHAVVLFIGHGDWDCLYATKDLTREQLLDRQNIWSLRRGTVIAIACRSGRELGSASVDAGAEAFLGFNDDFAWPLHRSSIPRFAFALKSGLAPLISGGSVGQGRDALEREHLEIYEHYWRGSGRSEPDSHVYAMLAEHIAYHCVGFGNQNHRPMQSGWTRDGHRSSLRRFRIVQRLRRMRGGFHG